MLMVQGRGVFLLLLLLEKLYGHSPVAMNTCLM